MKDSPAVLLVIDVQKAMDSPVWGRPGQPGMEAAIGRLLAHWRGRGWPVVHVRHDSTDPASPYRPELPTNAFKDEVAPLPGETVVRKRTNSAFIGTDLAERLAALGTRRIVATGFQLENCVEATVRMAGNLGYEVIVPPEAARAVDHTDWNGRRWAAEDVHALTLSLLDREYARVVPLDTLLREEA